MQVLLVRHDVQALVKIVGIFAVDGGGNVARGVQGSAVRAQDDARRHAVLLQIDDLRAVALL